MARRSDRKQLLTERRAAAAFQHHEIRQEYDRAEEIDGPDVALFPVCSQIIGLRNPGRGPSFNGNLADRQSSFQVEPSQRNPAFNDAIVIGWWRWRRRYRKITDIFANRTMETKTGLHGSAG
ncbi:hypothetical protein D9M70_546740 [compost metagenome]